MKKTAITLLLVMTAICGKAQNMYDALRYSESNYEGSARTMAMGNAFTALGGDPGAVAINPAGSAVAKYSQFTISPALSISTNYAQGTILKGDTQPYSFEKGEHNKMTKFSVPNIGITLNFDTHRTRGIKNVNIGFVANTVNRFQDALNARGTNSQTSFMGELAVMTEGFNVDELGKENAYEMSSAPWKSIVGVQSGMISALTGKPTEYIGASEKKFENGQISLGGPLNQTFQRRITGYKSDYSFNVGLNISDIVYLGANLGVNSFFYNSSERFTESAQDVDDFEIIYNETEKTYFRDMRYDYRYNARGSGVYGKFGVIVTPGFGLRFGAAIQTPTFLDIVERWQEAGATYYTDKKFDAQATSPEGEYSYNIISPFRFNIGAAYTFGKIAILSVDYEMCNYKSMKIKEEGGGFNNEFEKENMAIRNLMGASHILRAGFEIKPVPQLAIRAGYGLRTSPEFIYDDVTELRYKVKANTHKGSFGLGYSSKRSFYADAAFSITKFANEYIHPYKDYILVEDEEGNLKVEKPSPEILNQRNLWNVMVTFGFRF